LSPPFSFSPQTKKQNFAKGDAPPPPPSPPSWKVLSLFMFVRCQTFFFSPPVILPPLSQFPYSRPCLFFLFSMDECPPPPFFFPNVVNLMHYRSHCTKGPPPLFPFFFIRGWGLLLRMGSGWRELGGFFFCAPPGEVAVPPKETSAPPPIKKNPPRPPPKKNQKTPVPQKKQPPPPPPPKKPKKNPPKKTPPLPQR